LEGAPALTAETKLANKYLLAADVPMPHLSCCYGPYSVKYQNSAVLNFPPLAWQVVIPEQ
jgi:hypothetical protein